MKTGRNCCVCRRKWDNLRKRNSREIENAHKFALDKIAAELLGVRDSLENGIKAGQADDADVAKLQEGNELILKQLTQAMEKFNIVEVNPEGREVQPRPASGDEHARSAGHRTQHRHCRCCRKATH